MSQILDQCVAKMLSDVLFECTKSTNVVFPPSYVETPRETPMEPAKEANLENDDLSNQSSECFDKKSPSASINDSSEELNKENIHKSSALASSSMELVSAVS